MRVVGLTGGIASGKSLVSQAFRELGVEVLDADQVSREIVRPGQPALADIAAAFGPEALAEDGSLDEALRVGTPGGDKPLGFALLPSGRLVLAGVAEVDGQFEANPQSDLDVFLALVDPPVRADETGE